MPRYRLTIEYDGTGLSGWQRQANGISVQSLIEAAFTQFCQEDVSVVAAGRTDAGVHALAQVAHVDLESPRDPAEIREAVNFHLKPARIAIVDAIGAPADFHARFSATGRRYLYRIVNRRAPLVLDRDRAWGVIRPLDADAMHRAAQVLVGHHDFTSFRDSQCQAKSPMKTLDRLDVARSGDEISIRAEARSFLHHQVRNMVGTLKLAGEGKWTQADVAAALAARNRAAAGQTAPAAGLYLVGIDYEPR
jgi:tRNA pseudouridine38-40 synthase